MTQPPHAHPHPHDDDEAHAHAHPHESAEAHAHPHEPAAAHAHAHPHNGEHEHGEHGHAGHSHRKGFLPAWLSDFLHPHSHDTNDSIDRALEGSTEGIRAVKISLVALGVTAAFQLVIVAMTGSVALLADTIHNFADASTAIPLWIAFSIGRRAATRRFTYGYGRAEDLAGLFVIAMIAASAFLAVWESGWRLFVPREITYGPLVLLAGLVGAAGNEFVAQYRIRVGRRIGSEALIADGVHARTDAFTSLAVAVGALGVMAGFPRADAIAGLLISVMILLVLKDTGLAIMRRIMDGVDPRLVERADVELRAVPGVRDVDALRMRWIGHRLHAEVDVVLEDRLDLAAAHEVAAEVRHRLRARIAGLERVSVQTRSAAV
ncbi:MAG: cation diffusion facilitator family transporter [Dehalococcoidia bacterium]|nr:cation diffusion facilitator family transporter [Dehalococcoidia bacterium]